MQEIELFIQHHLALTGALALILVLLIIVEFIKLKRSSDRLSPAAATQLINHSQAAVVDVRPYDAYLSGHIVGAISIPIKELETKIKKIEKFKSQPIVVVCATGLESKNASQQLKQRGFNPQVLSGGIRAWRDASMPLVKG